MLEEGKVNLGWCVKTAYLSEFGKAGVKLEARSMMADELFSGISMGNKVLESTELKETTAPSKLGSMVIAMLG